MTHSLTVNLTEIPALDSTYAVTFDSEGNALSYVYDDYWDFSGMQKMAVGKHHKINFLMIEPEFQRDIKTTLACLCGFYKKRESKYPSKAQVNNWSKGLQKVAQALGSCNWHQLTDKAVFRKFEKNLARDTGGQGVSESYVYTITTALNKLNECHFCVVEVDGVKLSKLLNVLEGSQSIAIPINIYSEVVANAVGVVERYFPYRHEINSLMEEALSIREQDSGELTSRAQRINRKLKKIEHNVPDFKVRMNGTEIARVMSNCAIVVLAFTGMRVGELVSLTADSYSEIGGKDGKGIPVVKGETTKANEGKPLIVTWQTHPITKDALELVHTITNYLRVRYKSIVETEFKQGSISADNYKHQLREIESVFLNLGFQLKQTTYVNKHLSRKIFKQFEELSLQASDADVEEFDRLNPTRAGQLDCGCSLPRLSAHDFRRTFAVFFKRYGFGTAASIKFQYKHANINMSNYYANNARLQAMEDVLMDHDLLKVMNDEGIEMGVDIFDDIFNKSETLSGAGGERIAKDKFEQLQDGHKVYMSRDEIKSLVSDGTLSVVKLPTGGYCMNATCSRVCGIGQFAGEIKPCEHQVVTDKEAKVILRQNKRLIQSFRDMNTGDPMMNSILVGMKQRILRNELTIKKHNLRYEEFYDAVKGVMDVKEA